MTNKGAAQLTDLALLCVGKQRTAKLSAALLEGVPRKDRKQWKAALRRAIAASTPPGKRSAQRGNLPNPKVVHGERSHRAPDAADGSDRTRSKVSTANWHGGRRDPNDQPAAVYLVRHRDVARFKIGWAFHPQRRIEHLPEFQQESLDPQRSLIAWFDSRPQAEATERALHKLLRSNALPPPHDGDGCTEWFHMRGWDAAVRLLSQAPLDSTGVRFARLQPLDSQAPVAHVTLSASGEDQHSTWLRIEDLLLRAARLVPVQLDDGPRPKLRLIGIRERWAVATMAFQPDESASGHLESLRRALMDAETYQFRRQGTLHAYVQWFDYQGADLVLQFAALDHLQSWEATDHLPTQVMSLLRHLVRVCAPSSMHSGRS